VCVCVCVQVCVCRLAMQFMRYQMRVIETTSSLRSPNQSVLMTTSEQIHTRVRERMHEPAHKEEKA
jgi:hypothetical protein